MSAWDVVRHEYEDPHVQSYILWQAFQTAQAVDSPGSGLLAYSILAGRQAQSWTLPLGGSGELANALVRYLEDSGATVVCGKRVVELVVDGGRCSGVVTEDGERYLARRAVVSTIHVKQLVEMAPRGAWGEDFLYGIDTFDAGISSFAQYYADDRGAAVRRAVGHADRCLRQASSAGPRTCSRPGATCARAGCCTRAGCSRRRRPSSTRPVHRRDTTR